MFLLVPNLIWNGKYNIIWSVKCLVISLALNYLCIFHFYYTTGPLTGPYIQKANEQTSSDDSAVLNPSRIAD